MQQNGDLVLLDDGQISEDGIYNALSSRLRQQNIYTYIGDVLISVNPYSQLPIYGKPVMDKYNGATYFQNDPHIYALAENMYKHLRDGNKDQCVLISGESGAGKTEASKKVMEYIAAVSRSGGAVGRVAGMLLGSNPILEAFGNAKTIRNDNSSRFGKYMEIIFDYRAVPFGGKITNYLLEKVRVVDRAKNERSFHIFYMMLAGLKDDEMKAMGLQRDPNQYFYLANSSCSVVEGFSDKQEMDRVINAMKVLGFTPDMQNSIWRALAGIMLLGNVNFDEKSGHHEAAVVREPEVVTQIANLWHVGPQELTDALTQRTFATGGGNKQTLRKGGVVSPLSVTGSYDARDALAKSMYSGLFDFTVAQLNKAMSPPESLSRRLTLGILDIYGFEIFDNNSFEQFCINWCNEKLQQYFIELTLKTEQEDYAREGIEWTAIDYFNNRVICELIEANAPKAGAATKAGLVALINEACVLKNSDEQALLQRIAKEHLGTNEYFDVPNFDKGRPSTFVIRHYAGSVTYVAKGMIEKNTDLVFVDQRKLIEGALDDVIKTLMKNAATEDEKKRPESSGTKFKTSLQLLIETLSKCEPSYVRCIKPNEKKQALTSDEERFRHQIAYLGLMENLRVKRAGFCNRQTYEDFLQRYKMTVPRGKGSCWPIWRGSAKDGCAVIIKHFKWTPDMYKFGKTKVFIRKPAQLFGLENARVEALPMVATMITSGYRGHLARVYYRVLKAVVTLQRNFRTYKKVVAYQQVNGSTKISALLRAKWELTRYLKVNGSYRLQAAIRGREEFTRYLQERAASLVQAIIRKQEVDKLRATMLVQAVLRKHEALERHETLKKLIIIQACGKGALERRKYRNAFATFKIQTLAKAKFARQEFREQKAGRVLKRNLQLRVRRVWLQKLIALYADAKRANQWGRGLRKRWSEFKAPVAVDVSLFSRMEETWRYRLLLKSIKGREKPYREKVVALDLFRNKKKWDPAALWGDHNYLGSELNPTLAEFKESLELNMGGSPKIYYSDLVDKMNPNGKMVERAILLTDKGFYRMTPGKYKPDKHNDLQDIVKITLTRQNDHLVVLHHKDSRDSVINCRPVLGSIAKPQLRRTRSYSDIGGKRRASLMVEEPNSEVLSRDRSSTTAENNNNNNNNNNNSAMSAVAKEGDDTSERFSELVTMIFIALKENKLPLPPIEFENEISVNVSKKKEEKKTVLIKSHNSREQLNSFWEVGKTEHIIYSRDE